MQLSIVISSFNRSHSLSKALTGLSEQQTVDWGKVEIVVVDNNSTDDTTEVARGYEDVLPLKVIFEKRQGLAFARNAGVAISSGDTVLFTDDDLRFSEDWLCAYLEALRMYPGAAFLGGRILPDWMASRPAWLKDQNLALLNGVLGCYDLGTETREMTDEDPLPFGASFAIRRSLFSVDRIGLFRQDLGRCGENLGRGEDTELLNRVRQRWHQGVYVGKALCWHAVQPQRLTLPALWNYGIASGVAHSAIFPDPGNTGSLASSIEYLLKGCVQLVKGRGDRFRQCVINSGIQVGMRRAKSYSSNRNMSG